MIEPPKEIMLVGKKPRMTANGRESWVDKKILGRCPNIFIKLDFPKPHASDQRSFAVRPFAIIFAEEDFHSGSFGKSFWQTV